MYSSEIRTAVEPRPHLMMSMDGIIRHLGPHRNGCLRAFKQLWDIHKLALDLHVLYTVDTHQKKIKQSISISRIPWISSPNYEVYAHKNQK